MVISNPQHTEYSNLKEGRWAQYTCNHQNNVLSQLSPQWFCGNSCTLVHDALLHISGTNEPMSAKQVN